MSTLKNASKNSWDKFVNEIHPAEDSIRSFIENGNTAKSCKYRFYPEISELFRLLKSTAVQSRWCRRWLWWKREPVPNYRQLPSNYLSRHFKLAQNSVGFLC